MSDPQRELAAFRARHAGDPPPPVEPNARLSGYAILWRDLPSGQEQYVRESPLVDPWGFRAIWRASLANAEAMAERMRARAKRLDRHQEFRVVEAPEGPVRP